MKIGVKNLRSLIDTGLIHIKPINILLGQNSSGKSTFLRTFPLIKQSLETRTKGPILWYGAYVDFGDFNTALLDMAENNSISLDFEIDLKYNGANFSSYRFNSLIRKIPNNSKIQASLKLKFNKNFTYISELFIKFSDIDYLISIDDNQNASIYVNSFKLNITNLKVFHITNGLIPQFILRDKDRFVVADSRFLNNESNELIRKISKYKLSDATINRIKNQLKINSDTEFFNSLIQNKESKIFHKRISSITNNVDDYYLIRGYIYASLLPFFLTNLDSNLIDIFKNVSYIGPVRASAERFYRPQELQVDEVDSQGKNLALVLANFSEGEKIKFRNFCLNNFNFFPEAIIRGGNISIVVNFKDEDFKHNITDLGFGFSQLLPIITQIWYSTQKSSFKLRSKEVKIFAIEQPELHLHPKMQGRFINAIINVLKYCESIDVSVKFIIETHSETIVNGIGNRIYKKKIDKDDVNIVVFNRNGKSSSVNPMSYDNEGRLINWPYGFFDEI